jgi:predicted nucleotidyltransferase
MSGPRVISLVPAATEPEASLRRRPGASTLRGVDSVEQLLAWVVQRLAAGFGDRLLGVALFGSTARGEATADSDVDVLVIARGLPRLWDRDAALREVLPERPLVPPLSFLSRTPEEFDRDVRPLYLDLALDARVLFDRDGYLAGRLARLQELVREAKLRRRPDLFWEWEEPPTRPDWAITWEGVQR